MSVEFIYDQDCPNVAAARANLMRAFAVDRMPPKWIEWERSSPDTPVYAREFGSPAILVNGRDIAGLSRNAAPACRIYRMTNGMPSGVPAVELITAALSKCDPESGVTPNSRPFKKHLPLIPAMFFALLPKVACPACWPAYVGIISAFGLGFLARTEYLLPLTTLFLSVVLVGLGYGARNRRGYRPLFLGIVASTAVLFGKFNFRSDFLFYSGLVLLAGSSLWNTWPQKQSKTASCCKCAPARSWSEK